MQHLQLGSDLAYACNACGGVFLSHAHAARVRGGVDGAAPMLAELRAQYMRPVIQDRDTAVLRCPCCGIAMASEWVKGKHLRVDHCREHGTFFDAHELAAVVPPTPVFRAGTQGLNGGSFGDGVLQLVASLLLGNG